MSSEKTKILASIRVPIDLHEQILTTAESDDRSIQDQVRWLIKQGLKFRNLEKYEDTKPRRKNVNRTKQDNSGKSSDNL
jgi:hypothetical protein